MGSKSKLLLLGFLLLLFSTKNSAQDSCKVLFVGNSFTSFNDLSMVFYQLANAAGRKTVVGMHAPGGVSVGDISQGTSAHMNNPVLFDLIRSQNWDYLVLQDNQGRFVNNYGVFPSSSLVIEGHIRIRDSLKYYHPCAKMIWFAGWGPKSGFPPYASSGTELIDKIYNNYIFLQDTAAEVIAPIGPAWKRIIFNYPSINLWDSDDTHPGIFGTFLTAAVIYSTVYKSNPTESAYIVSGISANEAILLKTAAFQTVTDSVEVSGLSEICPKIIQFGDSLKCDRNGLVSWYFNGNYLSSSNRIKLNQSGYYSVSVTDSNSCTKTGFAQYFSTNSISKTYTSEIFANPNPVKSVLYLESTNEISRIDIFNNQGLLIFSEYFHSSKAEINLMDFPAGFYFLHIKTANENRILKISKSE